MQLLNYVLLDNTVLKWITAILLTCLVFVLAKLIKYLLIRKWNRVAQKTKNKVDDLVVNAIKQTKDLLVFFLGIYAGTRVLILSEELKAIINKGFYIALALQVGFWLGGVINYFTELQQEGEEKQQRTAVNAFGLFGKILVWLIVALVALQNVTGMELDALIASLGIGGIAVGLAVQNILKDIFASLSIFLDKPFLVGDYITVNDIGGNVENIGIKSTRVRTLLGEEVVFSNSDLLESRVHNYRKLERRREVLRIGISAETSVDVLRDLPALFAEVISAQVDSTFSRAHLSELGEYAFMYEVVYFIESPDYDVYMDAKEQIHLGILERLQEKEIELPYPTQSIVLHK